MKSESKLFALRGLINDIVNPITLAWVKIIHKSYLTPDNLLLT